VSSRPCVSSKAECTCNMKPQVVILPLHLELINFTKALQGSLLHKKQATCTMQGIRQHAAETFSLWQQVRFVLPEKTMDLAGLKPGSISTGCLARCQVSPTLADLVVFMPVMR